MSSVRFEGMERSRNSALRTCHGRRPDHRDTVFRLGSQREWTLWVRGLNTEARPAFLPGRASVYYTQAAGAIGPPWPLPWGLSTRRAFLRWLDYSTHVWFGQSDASDYATRGRHPRIAPK
jgi:hypothetical protein